MVLLKINDFYFLKGGKMNKIVVLFVVLALCLSACCLAKKDFSEDYVAACYDIGGLMASDGCQIAPCQECPTCEQTVTTVEPAPGEVNTGWCQAEIVGIPVKEDGSCTFCTINYVYDPKGLNPGDVYVVKGTPMEYTAGAYVYQYQEARFLECIAAQPFTTDPGYKPVYK